MNKTADDCSSAHGRNSRIDGRARANGSPAFSWAFSTIAVARSGKSNLLMSAVRYALAGVVNTAVGVTVVLALEFGVGFDPRLANAIGVCIGVLVSFVLNRTFVFGQSGARLAAPRFAVSVGLAFLASQGVLWTAALTPGSGRLAALLVQGSAMVVYSLSLFLLCRYWAFADAPVEEKIASSATK